MYKLSREQHSLQDALLQILDVVSPFRIRISAILHLNSINSGSGRTVTVAIIAI